MIGSMMEKWVFRNEVQLGLNVHHHRSLYIISKIFVCYYYIDPVIIIFNNLNITFNMLPELITFIINLLNVN